MDNKKFISQLEKNNKIYLPQNVSYKILNKLVKEISKQLWKEEEKQTNLYYTEMLLFAIADNEIYRDITNRVSINIS